jgi:hypothetical protein
MHSSRGDAFHEEPNAEAVPAGLRHADKALESTARGQVIPIVAKVIPVPECNRNAVPRERVATACGGGYCTHARFAPERKTGAPAKYSEVPFATSRSESQLATAANHSTAGTARLVSLNPKPLDL